MKHLLSLLFCLALTCTGDAQEPDDFPCTATQGLVVNFDKTTDEIAETECDSLVFLANYMRANLEEKFALIGIFTVQENQPTTSLLKIDRQQALVRAAQVKEALIKLGIEESRLIVYTSYMKPPGPEDHHDWPFYPEHFTYEIGVYLQIDY